MNIQSFRSGASMVAIGRLMWLAAAQALLYTAAYAQNLNLNVEEFSIATPSLYPGKVVAGPDGGLWFTEAPRTDLTGGKIGRISTAGMASDYSIPPPVASGLSENPLDLTAGPDGAVWFIAPYRDSVGARYIGLGRATTGDVRVAPYPGGSSAWLYAITSGPDGALWAVASHSPYPAVIDRITTGYGVTSFRLPGSSIVQGAAITKGPDGALWFFINDGNIGRITTGGAIVEYAVPLDFGSLCQIVSGSDGALWFSDCVGHLGRITTSGLVTEYQAPVTVRGLALGPDGAVWFTGGSPDHPAVGKVAPGGLFTVYNVPQLGNSLAFAPDGRLWYTVFADHAMARSDPISSSGTLPSVGVLAHVAAGAGWVTGISLINTSAAAVALKVVFHADDGGFFTLPLKVTSAGRSDSFSASSVSATVNPNATLVIETTRQKAPDLQWGWAEILGSGPVSGYGVFRYVNADGTESQGTVSLQPTNASKIILPYDNTPGSVSSFALASSSGPTTPVQAFVWDENGNFLLLQGVGLASGGHVAYVVPSLFPVTAGRRGFIEFVNNDGTLAALGLRGNASFSAFTSVPTIPGP